MTASALPRTGLKPKSDEDLVIDHEGEETAAAYFKTLEELIYANSLTEACKKKGCLSRRTFHRVKSRSREAWNLYVRARASRADERFDNLLNVIRDEPDPQKARVMFEAEKWTISKMNRGLYGDDPVTVQGSIQVEHGTSSALEEIKRRLARKRAALEGGGIQEKIEGGCSMGPHSLTTPPRAREQGCASGDRGEGYPGQAGGDAHASIDGRPGHVLRFTQRLRLNRRCCVGPLDVLEQPDRLLDADVAAKL